MRTAAAVLGLGLLVAAPAFANDSTAELAAGGLVFVQNPNIEMRAEQLFISPLEVRVTYNFFNKSDQDVTNLVAFPMPDITIANSETNLAIPTDDPQNFLNFATTVNGQPATAQVEQKVFAKGVDQTALLQQLNIPLAPHLPATGAALDALPRDKWQQLVELGLAAVVEYDDSGAAPGDASATGTGTPASGPAEAGGLPAGGLSSGTLPGQTGAGLPAATPAPAIGVGTSVSGAATPGSGSSTGAETGASPVPPLPPGPGAETGASPGAGAGAGGTMKQHLDPRWTLKTNYYWQQTFPSRQETVIQHRYQPSVGLTIETLMGNPQFPDHPEYQKKYCFDSAFLAAAAQAWQQSNSTNSAQYAEERLEYILSTGANWAGPIGDFTLIVDKGDTNALMSFCGMTGIEQLSPTQYKLHQTKFTPPGDLAILILTKQPIQ